MSGFVIGPLIAALFTAFWGIFMREFNAKPAEAMAPDSLETGTPDGGLSAGGAPRDDAAAD
jgi:hypothetical protein